MKIVPLSPELPPTRVVSVASGKGGVGKTSVTVNMAFALAQAGNKVCILDADLGLSNVDIILGVEPEKTLEDVLFEGVPMQEAIVNVGPGVDLVSGASGVPRLAELTRTDRRSLVGQFQALDAYDYLLVDNSPGITAQIISICLSSRDILLVVTPDATSITDAYALIKVLSQSGLWWNPFILVNRAKNPRQARLIYEKLRSTAGRRLKLGCEYLGCVLEDAAVSLAAADRRPLMLASPRARATRDIREAAQALDSMESVRGRDVAPVHFLDGSIMRLKQEQRGKAAVAATARRFKERHATLDAAPPRGRPRAPGQMPRPPGPGPRPGTHRTHPARHARRDRTPAHQPRPGPRARQPRAAHRPAPGQRQGAACLPALAHVRRAGRSPRLHRPRSRDRAPAHRRRAPTSAATPWASSAGTPPPESSNTSSRAPAAPPSSCSEATAAPPARNPTSPAPP